jgi:hypothetical protein
MLAKKNEEFSKQIALEKQRFENTERSEEIQIQIQMRFIKDFNNLLDIRRMKNVLRYFLCLFVHSVFTSRYG